jgi:hypothetical protein
METSAQMMTHVNVEKLKEESVHVQRYFTPLTV